MELVETEVLIIGGGLTGLTLAYLLNNQGIDLHLVEARERLGGRILTNYKEKQAPIEMGATWLGQKHQHLNALLEKLGIPPFQQILGESAIYEPISTQPFSLVSLPPNSEPSYRINGGSSQLINRLAKEIPAEKIHCEQPVSSIEASYEVLEVKTRQKRFKTKWLISTLPPYLLHKTITIQPALPDAVIQVMENTHTWMGDSIKIGLRFTEAFWRNDQSSGTIFSNVGPIPEMYDHSNVEDNFYALKGFLNGAYFSLTKAERLEIILKQLRKYYGEKIDRFVEYEELVWRKESFTFVPYDQHILPHQNNGHAAYQEAYLNGRFYIAGSETATDFPGYMEGAVASAQYIFNKIIRKIH